MSMLHGCCEAISSSDGNDVMMVNGSKNHNPCSLLSSGLWTSNNDNNMVYNPKDPKSLTDLENVINKELYQMDIKDREGALHDIHGVADDIVEEPEFVRSKLEELEVEILRPRYKSKEAFQLAMKQDQQYVRSLFLMFLRSDLFQVRDSAERAMNHFEMKQCLFGPAKLGRDITLDDLDTFDMEALKTGALQLLPQRDRSGRAVFFKTWDRLRYRTPENMLRVLWYIQMVAWQDEETQRKGHIVVMYNSNPDWIKTFNDPSLLRGAARAQRALPSRNVAMHHCFSDPAIGTVIRLLSLAVEKRLRSRTRMHQGSHVEVQYALMSFGIPTSAIPINAEGTMQVKDHLRFLQSRKKQEALIRKSNDGNLGNIIVIPSKLDILYGRGTRCRIHFGNMKLSNLLEEKSEEYSKVRKLEKVAISKSIVETLKNEGSRFLRQDKDGLWMEVDDKTAADKVSHGFRNRKPVVKDEANIQQRKDTTAGKKCERRTSLGTVVIVEPKRSKKVNNDHTDIVLQEHPQAGVGTETLTLVSTSEESLEIPVEECGNSINHEEISTGEPLPVWWI